MPDAIIEESFLGPTELADIFAATALNIHPCLYDAYGMTIVEAASQGLLRPPFPPNIPNLLPGFSRPHIGTIVSAVLQRVM